MACAVQKKIAGSLLFSVELLWFAGFAKDEIYNAVSLL